MKRWVIDIVPLRAAWRGLPQPSEGFAEAIHSRPPPYEESLPAALAPTHRRIDRLSDR